MFSKGDYVVAIRDETFSTIYSYGFGTIVGINEHYYDDIIYEVKLDDTEEVIEVSDIVSATDWVEYVDERDAKVVRVKYRYE